MLSPREQIMLEQIERHLAAEDPALDAQLGGRRRLSRWLLMARIAVVVGAVTAAILLGWVVIAWLIAVLALGATLRSWPRRRA
jgi:hypothetical protein